MRDRARAAPTARYFGLVAQSPKRYTRRRDKEVSMPKSRFLILALALPLIGCGGKTDAPAPPHPDATPDVRDDAPPAAADQDTSANTAPPEQDHPAPPVTPPAPAPAWTTDLKAMTFPASPAAGRVNGRP